MRFYYLCLKDAKPYVSKLIFNSVTFVMMMSNTLLPDITTLFKDNSEKLLLQRLSELNDKITEASNITVEIQIDESSAYLLQKERQWQRLANLGGAKNRNSVKNDTESEINSDISFGDSEQAATDWLIDLFNTLFSKHHVQLVRGKHEPEYFPANNGELARIEFAHGFFASALHEISHWCVAGKARRQLSDFGYWYAPDGRSSAQQQAFERVEIKPQALECLFSIASKRPFHVSQDNLFADFDTSHSTFANDVYQQAAHYITKPQTLPSDAQTLLRALLIICG